MANYRGVPPQLHPCCSTRRCAATSPASRPRGAPGPSLVLGRPDSLSFKVSYRLEAIFDRLMRRYQRPARKHRRWVISGNTASSAARFGRNGPPLPGRPRRAGRLLQDVRHQAHPPGVREPGRPSRGCSSDEAKVAALLSHPNIVQVFDFGKIDGQYYLAMEWDPGRSPWIASCARAAHGERPARAARGRRRRPGDVRTRSTLRARARRWTTGRRCSSCTATSRPGNVLVSRDGIVKLADFGIVKSSVNLERTVAGVVKGKYAYMSPEQLTNRELDRRSDLFSLGIVLYESRPPGAACSSAKRWRPPSWPRRRGRCRRRRSSPGLSRRTWSASCFKCLDAGSRRSATRRRASCTYDLERYRTAQHWTSGGRELAMLMAKLFPPDASRASPAPPALHAGCRVPGRAPESGAGQRRPAGALRVPGKRWTCTRPALGCCPSAAGRRTTGVIPSPDSGGPERSPGLVAAAVGAAVLGTRCSGVHRVRGGRTVSSWEVGHP